jgi:hypothetical protein
MRVNKEVKIPSLKVRHLSAADLSGRSTFSLLIRPFLPYAAEQSASWQHCVAIDILYMKKALSPSLPVPTFKFCDVLFCLLLSVGLSSLVMDTAFFQFALNSCKKVLFIYFIFNKIFFFDCRFG